ncbi:MAG: DUF2089 domain-containing protein [Thermoflexales bacterium]|nr:DUF2089 domain-containing protein [Thermoflexales bacterium]
MNNLPAKCPICSGDVTVTELHCPSCDTTLRGHFSPSVSPFPGLSAEQIDFVRAFIKCEGKMNRLEGELNLSYPTLRARLQEVIRAMGFEPARDEERPPQKLSDEERRRVLDDLDKGNITSEQAMALLRGKGEGA